jgi:hypothetical protein
MDYFVMLITQKSSFTPMMNDDEIAKYETLEDARTAARDNLLGYHFGYEIFCMGEGEE